VGEREVDRGLGGTTRLIYKANNNSKKEVRERMRVGWLIFGAIVLCGSVFNYMYVQEPISTYESVLGQLGRFFDPAYQQSYERLKMYEMVSVVGAIIGFIFVLVGVFTSKKE